MAVMRSHTLPNPIFLSFCVTLASFCNAIPRNDGGLQGMFIFGSSVVDNGNNNNQLLTIAKANYPPYGVDYPSGPTGRFSNAKNVADLIGDQLSLPPIPAFADPETKGDAIIYGVNFGSGGSGILDETGIVVGKVSCLNEQIGNFEGETLPQLEEQLKSDRTEILPNYLFLIAAGNNDYLLNYFIFNGTSPQDFAAKLVSTYSDQLMLLSRVDQIILQMPGSDILVVNSIKIITDIINNAASTGFSNVSGACCELSLNGASCRGNGKVCEDRKSYAYFDGQHNTEALSAVIASKAFTSQDPSEVHPLNLHSLVHSNH